MCDSLVLVMCEGRGMTRRGRTLKRREDGGGGGGGEEESCNTGWQFFHPRPLTPSFPNHPSDWSVYLAIVDEGWQKGRRGEGDIQHLSRLLM